MAEYSRFDAARRSGVDQTYVDRLIELGIVSPDSSDRLSKGDVRRIQMAQTLQNAGITLESLAASIQSGHGDLGFMDAPTYGRFATLSDETFEGLSQRTGLPLNLLMLIREATGGATPTPDDRVREDEFAVVPLIEIELAMGFRPVSIERTLRILGESLRRVAATESDAWRTDMMEPMLERGATAIELGATSSSPETVTLDQATDEAVLAIWHAQQAQSWSTNIIGGFEKALTDAGLLKTLPRPPAICFLDITGYTRLTHERGDEAAADLAERLGRLVNRSSLERGGRPVKWLGDGVMVHFRDPGRGVVAALEMVKGVSAAGLPPAHVGLHAGPVLFQQGDYFGRTVNLASRIADYARPGEVLVTQEVVDASAGVEVVFTEVGPVELKGLSDVVRLHAAHRANRVDEIASRHPAQR
jgi:class 3 adenylate cyclase